MTLYTWSKTAASNDSADATINWLEGQAPSTVNNSARAMMAAVAKYRDDVSGSNPTSGTSSAYTLTSNQGFTSLSAMDGDVVAFTPHATNTLASGNTTLNVDTLGAKNITIGGQSVVAGSLIAGTPYVVYYDNASGTFKLRDIVTLPWSLPIGAIVPWSGSTAPNSNFALCFGQSIAGASFPTLRDIYAAMSPTFPYGGNATNFNIPDLRGRVAAGQDNMGGSAAGRIGTALVTDSATINGQTIGSSGGSSTHAQTTGELATHLHGVGTIADSGHTHTATRLESGFKSGSSFDILVWSSTSPASPGSTIANSVTNGTANLSGSTANQGSSTAMAWLQPTIILPFIIRVL